MQEDAKYDGMVQASRRLMASVAEALHMTFPSMVVAQHATRDRKELKEVARTE